MITSLVKTTARTTAGAVRLASKPGLWLTRTLAAAVFKPPQPDGPPEPPPPKRPSKPRATRRAAPKPTHTRSSRTRSMPARDVPPAHPPEPHHALNTPVGEPDPTEWPDPYDRRPDPRDPQPDGPIPFGEVPHTPTGAVSTSEPHPDQDPEAVRSVPPKR